VHPPAFADAEFLAAIDDILSDRALHERMAAMSTRIKGTSGTVRAADLIEGITRGG
jgi:hypothetical protein